MTAGCHPAPLHRLLLLAALLTGLLLMHGLASDHMMSMPTGHTSQLRLPPPGLHVEGVEPSADVAHLALEPQHTSTSSLVAAPMGGHLMGSCLAMIGASLLLPLLIGRRIRRRLSQQAMAAFGISPQRIMAVDRLSTLPAPSLTSLCISRT